MMVKCYDYSHCMKIAGGITINGDLKHGFSGISETEWRHTLRLIDYLREHCEKLVIIKGNHDAIAEPIARKRGIATVDHHRTGSGILLLHGDILPMKGWLEGIETLIIGHEHPAISLRQGSRVESYKCFLKGRWRGKTLIVQPSFTQVTDGVDILREKPVGPMLPSDKGEFEVYVVADSVYAFGKVKAIKA